MKPTNDYELLVTRLSHNFTLLDLLYDRDNYMTGAYRQALAMPEAQYAGGQAFCREFLEALVAKFGPCMTSCGLRFGGIESPHLWDSRRGYAVDAAFPDQEVSPRHLAHCLDVDGVGYHRIITYAGSEFACYAYSPAGNSLRLYENVYNPKVPGEKPYFKNHGTGRRAQQVRAGAGEPPHGPWRRAEGEPIFHTRRAFRAHHVRVGRYFTLLDMCRSAQAVLAGANSVVMDSALSDAMTAPAYSIAVQYAQMLDKWVADTGTRVSIVRGHEGVGSDTPQHRWNRLDAEHWLEVSLVRVPQIKSFPEYCPGAKGLRALPDGSVLARIPLNGCTPTRSSWVSHRTT